MPEHDLGYLEDVRYYAARAISHTRDVTLGEFIENTAKQDAVIRCLIVIGEAAGHLSKAARETFPHFAWSSMTGMRHVLVHDYGRIDFVKVWDVVANDLPPLQAELQQYLAGFE